MENIIERVDNAENLIAPDADEVKDRLRVIKNFQAIVKSQLVRGLDFGLIPGTEKPSLLKPGAEKIAKLLGLSDTYEIIERTEDYDKPLFSYIVKCKLCDINSNKMVSEGLGQCNSRESKYKYRWVTEQYLPQGFDKKNAKTRKSKSGNTLYQVPNEDVYSQVNTILKMAKKRALVDAVLSAGRLSSIFTQDIEDFSEINLFENEEKKQIKRNE